MNPLLPIEPAVDHINGKSDARVLLVEYCDFECPYCGAAYYELKQLQRALGDHLAVVFRHFPLTELHPHAFRAAAFAQAAASIGKFWAMHDLLFENQRALADEDLIRYARRIGMDKLLIRHALDDRFTPAVQRDIESGLRSAVHGTPTLFINGERFKGRATADALMRAVAVRGR